MTDVLACILTNERVTHLLWMPEHIENVGKLSSETELIYLIITSWIPESGVAEYVATGEQSSSILSHGTRDLGEIHTRSRRNVQAKNRSRLDRCIVISPVVRARRTRDASLAWTLRGSDQVADNPPLK